MPLDTIQNLFDLKDWRRHGFVGLGRWNGQKETGTLSRWDFSPKNSNLDHFPLIKETWLLCQRGGSQNRNQFEGWGCIWKPAKLLSANFELGPRSIGLETKNLELAGPVFLREVVQVLAGHLGKGVQ